MRSGKKHPYVNIQYIFIKQSRESQTMGLRAANTTIHKYVYDSYLKFSETEKIHLITKDSKEDLISQLQNIAEKIGVEIVDKSE